MERGRYVRTTTRLAIDQLLRLAGREIPDGWLIADSEEGAIFGPLRLNMDAALMRNCSSIVIFDSGAEISMEKEPRDATGVCRYSRKAGGSVDFAISQLVFILGEERRGANES